MGYERLVKSTIARTLQWSPTEENAVDQVAAIGLASRHDVLGSALLRMEALDAHATRQVIFLTSRRLAKRFKIERNYAKRVAVAVLHELMRPNCMYCGGKGETHESGKQVTDCPHCNGTGMHRYSNTERVHLLGQRTYNEKIYEDALSYVRECVRGIINRTAKRLEDPPVNQNLQQ